MTCDLVILTAALLYFACLSILAWRVDRRVRDVCDIADMVLRYTIAKGGER